MENKEQQILSEIRTLMASVRQQMEMLDARMSELQQLTRSENEDVAPIVLDIDDLPFDLSAEEIPTPVVPAEPEPVVSAEPEPVVSVEPEPVVPAEPEPVVSAEPEPVVPAEPEPVVLPEPEEEPAPEPVGEDLPEEIMLEEPTPADEPAKPVVNEAIIDAMTEKQAWRTDMPGTQVKDVRLAISLHERVLFINHLFAEDPMAFQSTVNKVNASQSLDEVVEYVRETFPQWDLDSDLVYRFMMAVRRKIR